MKHIIIIIHLMSSLQVFGKVYHDYTIARAAFNGVRNLPVEQLEGIWEIIIEEVYCTKNEAEGNILHAYDEGTLLSIEVSKKKNIIIDFERNNRYLKGIKANAEVKDNRIMFGHSSVSGFEGSDGEYYLALSTQSEYGWECPNLSILSLL